MVKLNSLCEWNYQYFTMDEVKLILIYFLIKIIFEFFISHRILMKALMKRLFGFMKKI